MGQKLWIYSAAALFGCIAPARGQQFPLLTPKMESDGMHLNMHVSPGSAFHLEASLDNVTWSHLWEGMSDSGVFEYLDIYCSQFPLRFYRINQFTAPPNDKWQDAAMLTGSACSAKGWNYLSSVEAAEPQHSYLYPGQNSVWFKWTAPEDSHVTLETINSYFDTMLAVYAGTTLSDLEAVAKRIRPVKALAFDAVGGRQYYIAVDGAGGQCGAFELQLTATPSFAGPAVAMNGTVLNLVDLQNPWDSQLQLSFSDDGTSWQMLRMHKPFLSGTVKDTAAAKGGKITATLAGVKDGVEKPVDLSLDFNSSSGGVFTISSDFFNARGPFANFHSVAHGLAPTRLDELVLTTVRTYTSTGPVGQAHYYTFVGNRFHDANNEEHALGHFTYSAEGDDAVFVTDYTGPADFVGDHHEIQMHFTSPWGGQFTSTYRRNDNVNIIMNGDFELN
jgi:hypothetical protein